MVHKKDFGKMGEALVASACLRRGLSVFVEFGDNSKIDLIVCDSADKLHRLQVKVVSRDLKDPEGTNLLLYKNGPNSYHVKYQLDDVDWFVVVDAKTLCVAWVPATILNEVTSSVKLRHSLPRNGQRKGIRMFADYTEFPFN